MNTVFNRIRSIDVFRAVTVFLMIFVNDLEDVPNTPTWIKHVPDEGYGLGLADTVFPAFLFIVGLSIPYAFKNRMENSGRQIPWRIVTRSFALIVIGFFLSNIDNYNSATALLSEPVWEMLTTLSFFFIFLDFRKQTTPLKRYLLQGFGIALLIAMSLLYKSKDPAHNWLHFTWWEILGLIGWSYLVCGLIYYYSKGKLWVQAAFTMFFILFNIDAHYGFFDVLSPLQEYVWIAGNGAMQAFTMAGIFVSVLYIQLSAEKKTRFLWICLSLTAAALFNLGFIVNGGIPKSRDTPGWVLICTAISIVVYLLFIYIVDIKHKYHWFKIIEPAGKNAFTCYLISSLFYPVFQLTNLDYPHYLSFGAGGVIKCLLFALAMVWITALLAKIHVRLKI